MRVAVVVALFVCVALTQVSARNQGAMRRTTRRLEANIAMVQEALRICEAEFESSTIMPKTGVASNENMSGGASGRITGRVTVRDIARLNLELRGALQELEECKLKLQGVMWWDTTDSDMASGGESK